MSSAYGAAAMGLAGPIIGGLFSNYSARRASRRSEREALRDREFQRTEATRSMIFSADQAQRQMDFQERMASTQYQRAAVDLSKAGLNRILAIGSPSAAPMGASGHGAAGSGSRGQTFDAQSPHAFAEVLTALSNARVAQAQSDEIRARTRGIEHDNERREARSVPYQQINNLVDRYRAGGYSAREILDAVRSLSEQLGQQYYNRATDPYRRGYRAVRDAVTGSNVIYIRRGNDGDTHPNRRR